MEDTTKNNNPHFSRTDTTSVEVPEEAWKKILSPEVFYVARQKELKDLGPVGLKTLKKQALTTALFVEIHYLRATQNLIVVVVGQVFLSP